ncbi:hypothetical protein NZK33_13270 [Cyanobium sp. FGCU-6]|nr:hypothetical protein [Cyanobium sp. FGCU6]
MTYVRFGGNGDNTAPEWGLFQFQPGKWRLAFCLGEDLNGWEVLFEPKKIVQNGKEVTLSVLKCLDIEEKGDDQSADKWPIIRIDQPGPFSDLIPGIRINHGSLLIENQELSLELLIRLELSKSIGLTLGTLEAVAEPGTGATFMLNTKSLAFTSEVLEIPFTELSLGPLLRISPKNEVDNKIKIKPKEKTISFPPLNVEVNLICPMDQGKQNLLQLPTKSGLKLVSDERIVLPLDEDKEISLNVENGPLKLPSLSPSFGSLIDKAVELQLVLTEPWKITNGRASNPTLGGKADFKVTIGNTQHLKFSTELEFNLQKGCLRKSVVCGELEEKSYILDLGIFAFKLESPSSSSSQHPPVMVDFDLLTGDMRILNTGAKVQVYLPGSEGAGTTQLSESDYSKSFLFDLDSPPAPLDPLNNTAILLIGPRGLSFYAKQNPQEVALKNGTLKPLQPLQESNGIQSILEVRRNRIIQATFFARTELPGFSSETPIKVLAELALRQQKPKEKPELLAALQLEKADGKPLGTLGIGPVESQVDEIRMQLKWDKDGWDLKAKIDGKLWLETNLPELVSGFSKEKPACFLDLDLSRANDFALQLTDAPRLELLDGMVSITLMDLNLINDDNKLEIKCTKSNFHFQSSGPVEIDVQPGPLILSIPIGPNGCSPSLRLGNAGQPVSLTAKLGPSVKMNGQVQWIDNQAAGQQGIGVAGAIAITGLSSIRAAAFFGCERKESGEAAVSAFIYAETDTDIQLYPGVYLKSVGAGMGLNRQLEAIGVNPSPECILPRMNTLKPSNLDAWKFVKTSNIYLSLVATIMIGSVAGDSQQISPFLLWLVLSIDSQANITAAAKLWLSSSPGFVRNEANFSRPAAEAALVILPQKRMLSMRVRTKKGTAIEKGGDLNLILDRCDVQFSYFMSPTLLDFYLEEASYNAQWVGFNWQVLGTFRTVIVSFGAMSKATLIATANFDRKLGGGSVGAKFSAKLRLGLEIAGLISSGELLSYALVAASIAAEAELWLKISIKVFGKEFSKRFSTTKRINAALSGTMAFQSSGSAGIRASLAVKTSICGHSFSASGRLDVKDELVESIRSRVALFEKRLKAYKEKQQESMQGVSRGFELVSMEIPEPSKKDWIIYFFPTQNQQMRLLIMPTSENDDWLGIVKRIDPQQAPADQPLEFITRLKQIEVLENGTTIYTKEILKPSLEDTNNDLVMALLGSFQETSESMEENWLNATLLQDQRVRSSARNYWTDLDRVRLADGVLPIDFKSLDEVEEEGQADSIFEDVERYLALNQKAHRRYRHGLHLITNEAEKIRSLRGLVCQEATRILNTGELSPEIRKVLEYLPYLEVNNNETGTRREVRLTFEGDRQGNPVQLHIDASSTDDPLEESIRSITICTPRQRCVATKENPYLEVRIPIHFSAVSDSKLAKDMIGDFLHRVDSFEVYRQLPNEKEPSLLADNVQLSFREVRESSVKEFLILDPYLLTDRLDLEWDSEMPRLKFKDPRLMTSAMPEVVYEVRVKPLALSMPGSKGKPICLGVHRIPLQVLQPAPSLADLVASIKVSSLCSDSPLKDLKIGRLKAEKFECLNPNDPIFKYPDSHDTKPNELEIWLEESLIEAVGFFGEPIVLRDPQKPESLDELKTRPPQTRHGKVLVGQWTGKGIVFNNLNDQIFRLKPGYTYRMFVGHRSSGSWHGLLTELPCALLGEKNQDEMQFSSTIEVISSEEKPRYLAENEFEIQRVSWTRNLLQLLIHPVQCGLLGGFEVNIRDQHERHLNISLEREVISHKYFLCSEMDYRNDSRWEFASPPKQDETINTQDYAFDGFYQDNYNNERTQLMQKAKTLIDLLDEANTPWTKLYQVAQEFWSSVWAYQRTGAYVNSRDRWEELKMRFRFLFTGLHPLDPITMESLSERWSECSKALLEVENTDVDALVADGGEEGTQSLADFETAVRITAIIRHCQEITEEIFGNAAPDVPVLPGDEMSVLPGEIVWRSLLTDKQNHGRLTKKLLELFGQTRQRTSILLKPLLLENYEEEILDDPKDIQACVTHSTALVKLMNALKSHLQGKQGELVKRPHHTVQSTMSGNKRVPVATDVKDLLPPHLENPLQEPTAQQPCPPMYFANLLERLGFAADLAAYDALGQPINGQLLCDELIELEDSVDNDHRLVVWLPQENRGPEPDETESQGDKPEPYAFLKVALIPKTLIPKEFKANGASKFENFLTTRGIKGDLKKLHQFLLENQKNLGGSNSKEIRIRPVGNRWLSLCATAGHTISYWDGYDDKRHVFEVSVRAMSRHERLLRWAGVGEDKAPGEPSSPPIRVVRTVRQFTPEEEKAVNLEPRPVYVHPNPSRIQFSYALPVEGARSLMNNLSAVRSGWRGVEVAFGHQINDSEKQFVEYVKQRRQGDFRPNVTLRHESALRPRVMELREEIKENTAAIIQVDDTWGCQDAPRPSYLLVGKEMMKLSIVMSCRQLEVERGSLGTLATPHQAGEWIRLLDQRLEFEVAETYDQGSRMIKLKTNDGSSRPTPNCYMAIDSELFWIKAVSSDGEMLLVDYGQLDTENVSHKELTKAMLFLPAEESCELRMFLNERLLSSPNLPYCYQYSMVARVHYEYNAGDWPRVPSAVAVREPARLARWTLIDGKLDSDQTISVSLVLSRNWDLMTHKEQVQCLQMTDHDTDDVQAFAFYPDPYLSYDLFYFHPLPSDPGSGVFFHLESILMPLAPGYKTPPEGEPKPFAAKSSQYLDFLATNNLNPEDRLYRLDLHLVLPAEIQPKEFKADQLRLQIRRNALSSTLRRNPDTDPE